MKFQGGREVSGVLKGYDQLVNVVLDEAIEYLQGIWTLHLAGYFWWLLLDSNGDYQQEQKTRNLGLCVCRGTAVMLICPEDGMEEIANPFIQAEEGGE